MARALERFPLNKPIEGDELRVIKRYLATRDDDLPWLFVTERGGQLTRSGIYRLITRSFHSPCGAPPACHYTDLNRAQAPMTVTVRRDALPPHPFRGRSKLEDFE